MGSVFGVSAGEVKSSRSYARLVAGARTLLDTLYPPHCLACDAQVQDPGTLCGQCWSSTPFVDGLACDKCGIPLLGDKDDGGALCDDCLTVARPWSHGRSALVYGNVARQMVLALKYGDRHDIAAPAGRWMARKVAPLIRSDTIIVPVPLHRLRLFKRRYNQSALLAATLARVVDRPHIADLLLRTRRTTTQDGRTRAGRFENLQGAISAQPKRASQIEGRHVLLVDDVMTSGATLAAATEACFQAGADDVDVVVMARVGRDE
jgi:ComF family protein